MSLKTLNDAQHVLDSSGVLRELNNSIKKKKENKEKEKK